MQHLSRKGLVVLCGLVSCSLLAVLFVLGLSTEVSRGQQRFANSLITLSEQVITESAITLDNLAALNLERCDAQALLKMRQQVFLSKNIKDVGFFQDGKLVCTTTGGVLPQPLPLSAPDFVTTLGVKVWLAEDLIIFDHRQKGTILKKGNYNVVIPNNTFERLKYGENHWELITHNQGQIIHLAGTPGIFRAPSSAQASITTQQSHYFHNCNSQFKICIALSVDNHQLIKNRPIFTFIAILCCFIFGFFAATSCHHLINKSKTISARIRRGLKKGYFQCHIQPIVNLSTGKIIGGEVLARFNDPYGELFPEQFIPQIRELNLSWPFTLMMVNKSLGELSAYQRDDLSQLKISLNIFPCDIENNKVAELATLTSVKAFAGKITIEITEDSELDSQVAQHNLKRLSKQNIDIAIDDFGTGYSNLKQLNTLHCQYLKIDKSFIFDLESGSIRSSLVPHMVEIAHQSKLKVVAEGIENETQRQLLNSLKVEFGQGWLFGKPTAIKHFMSLYQTNQERAEQELAS
ncbi:EAL domain-containing protein [Agarivorans sp.]|uniref:EAL domain-containing protein n=1 Tax=Agarivorans sp. TaxID=1872412 RepID=UPI003D03BB06